MAPIMILHRKFKLGRLERSLSQLADPSRKFAPRCAT